jgi:hypothetical protein
MCIAMQSLTRASLAAALALLCAGCPAPPPPESTLPQTGQTQCWNDFAQPIVCAGTGHDGDIRAGVPRSFTNNQDGTITDNATGLMWEVECSGDRCGSLHNKDTKYTWFTAVSDHIATLNAQHFAGHNDWRLPNLLELLTLWDLDRSAGLPNDGPAFPAFDNCKSSCTVTECSCTSSNFYQNGGFYWSSTWASTYLQTQDPYKASAFFLSFFQGDTAPAPESDVLSARGSQCSFRPAGPSANRSVNMHE